MGRGQALWVSLAILAAIGTPAVVVAAPYASNVVKTGTTVNFILNEPADALSYSINGGAAVALDATTKGTKSFTLPSTTAMFSITAEKNAAVGYSIPTGGTVALIAAGLSQDSREGGLNIISDDANLLTRFNSPRGVSVSNNPNAPHFGTAYITNSAAGSVSDGDPPAVVRTLIGEGVYALRADQSDAFGLGDTATNPTVEGFPAWNTTSANSPFRATVADDGNVYVTDWSDVSGSLIRVSPDLMTGTNVLAGFGGTQPLPAGQNHGSISGAHIEGSIAGGNLTVYTIDEDLTTAHVTGSGSTGDQNSLWRYDIGSGPLPSSALPSKIADELIPIASSDVTRGADGKFYMTQYRFDGNQVGLVVTDADGAPLFNSLAVTREMLGNPTAPDILRNVQGVAVSEDQNWLAIPITNSDVAVVPLIDGIPDLANRLVVNTGTDVNFGRDIAFDAAGNIHFVSSGQARYRVLAPGGHTQATTSFNGTTFDFDVVTIGGGGDNADFDNDGDVDGDDFLTFQRGFGQPGDRADGDANSDQIVNADDLAVFQSQFGTVPAAPATAAVPEPTTWALAALAAVVCVITALPRRRAALVRVKAR